MSFISIKDENLQESSEAESGESEPPTKQRKVVKTYPARYTSQDLEAAFTDISKGVSYNQASKLYGIPIVTLHRKFMLKDSRILTPGPKRQLSQDEEESIAESLQEAVERNESHPLITIREATKSILATNSNKETLFKNGCPSRAWCKRFLERYKTEIEPAENALPGSPASTASYSDLIEWWKAVDSCLKEDKLMHIMTDPKRISHCAEMRVEFNNLQAIQGYDRTSESVWMTVLADGSYLKPYVIYAANYLPVRVRETFPESLDYNYNLTGSMNEESFSYYLEHIFYSDMSAKGVKFPVLLFTNQYKFSETIQELCSSLQIILVPLYDNAKHMNMHLDISYFKPMKNEWSNFIHTKQNDLQFVTDLSFAPLFAEFIPLHHRPEWVRIGFEATGIFPWSLNGISSTNLGVLELKKIKMEKVQKFKSTVLERFKKMRAEASEMHNETSSEMKYESDSVTDHVDSNEELVTEIKEEEYMIYEDASYAEEPEIKHEPEEFVIELVEDSNEATIKVAMVPSAEGSQDSSSKFVEYIDMPSCSTQQEPTIKSEPESSSETEILTSLVSLKRTPLAVRMAFTFENMVLAKLKTVYGKEFKRFAKQDFVPENSDQDILHRVVQEFLPATEDKIELRQAITKLQKTSKNLKELIENSKKKDFFKVLPN